MDHLDRDAVQAILRGDPEAIARHAAHLQTECELCESMLLDPDLSVPELEGEVDRLLLSSSDRAAEVAPLDEIGFRRLLRAIRGPTRWPAISAVAAVLVAGAFGVLLLGDHPDQGIKGTRRIALELQTALRTETGRLERIEPGAAVPAGGGILLLRYHATEKGTATLLRQQAGQPPEVLGSFELQPGMHDLASREGLAGVPLPDARGTLRLWVVASPSGEPPSEAEALAAISEQGQSPFTTTEIELELR